MALGDLIIRVGGDVSGWKSSLQDASSSAEEFTDRIASTVSRGVTLVDQYGNAVQSTIAPVRALTAEHNALSTAVTGAGRAAEGMGFNFRYAFFGVKDLMEGRTKFAIAEVANELVAMGGSALMVAGGVAAVGAAGYAIFKMANYAKDTREETQKLTEALSALDRPITRINDELTLTADKLANEIAKLEHKPENGIAVALDEARVMADKLTDSLDGTLKKVAELMSKQKTPWYELFTPGTEETDKRQDELKRQINQDSGNPAAQKQDLQFELQQVQSDIVKALSTRSRELGRVDFGPELARLREYATVYQAEIDHISNEQKVADLTQQKDKLAAAEQARKAAEEAARKVAAALKSGDEDQLASLKASHQLSVGEVTQYWQQRLAAESGNATRVHEIGLTLGNLYQEQDKVIQRVAEHGLKLGEEQAKKMEAWKKKLDDLAYEAQEVGDKLRLEQDERSKKLFDIGAKSTASGQEGAASFQKLEAERAYGLLINKTSADAIALDKQLMEADAAVAEAKIDALKKEQEAENDQVKKAELGLQLQQAIIAAAEKQYQWETKQAEAKSQHTVIAQVQNKLGNGSFVDKAEASTASLIAQSVDGIAQALARAALQGKNFGQIFSQLGKSLAMSALTSVLKEGISQIALSLVRLVPAFGAVATAQTAAAAAAKAAASAFGVAQVTSAAAVGAANAAAATALIPIIGPALAPAAGAAMFADIIAWAPLAAFAEGGVPPLNIPSIVGEKGPELFIPHQLGTIIPNHQLKSFAASGPSAAASITPSGATQHFHGDMNFTGVQNVREFSRAMASFLKTASPGFSPYSK